MGKFDKTYKKKVSLYKMTMIIGIKVKKLQEQIDILTGNL